MTKQNCPCSILLHLVPSVSLYYYQFFGSQPDLLEVDDAMLSLGPTNLREPYGLPFEVADNICRLNKALRMGLKSV